MDPQTIERIIEFSNKYMTTEEAVLMLRLNWKRCKKIARDPKAKRQMSSVTEGVDPYSAYIFLL